MATSTGSSAKVRHSEPSNPRYNKVTTASNATTGHGNVSVATPSFLSPDRSNRIKQTSGRGRMSAPVTGTGSSTGGAKRKLVVADNAVSGPESRARERISSKKPRTQSPIRASSNSKPTAVPTPSYSQQARSRPASYSGSSTPVLSAATLKRHNERDGSKIEDAAVQQEKVEVSTNDASAAEQRYLSYAAQQHASTQLHNAQGLFSRHADPSVLSTPPPPTRLSNTHPVERKPSSANSSPFEFPDYKSSPSVASGAATPPPFQFIKSPDLHTPRSDDGMVDLSTVVTPTKLEAVEGDDIWSVMMSHTTPRKGRQFPSEHVRTLSEEREIQFLRRRRLATSGRDPVVTDSMMKTETEGESSPQTKVVSSSVGRSRLRQRRLAAQYDTTSPSSAVPTQKSRLENVKEEDETNEWEESEEVDRESMEHKIARLGAVRKLTWRHFMLSLITAAGVLCWAVILYPVVVYYIFTPSLPYCDSESSNALTVMGTMSNPATALQPFGNGCRSCPMNGICTEGKLVSCKAHYHLYQTQLTNVASCMESIEVGRALQAIAEDMRTFIHDQVVDHVCRELLPEPSLSWLNWAWWWNNSGPTTAEALAVTHSSATTVVLYVSELRKLVVESPLANNFNNLSEEDMITRSLDLALSTFQRVTDSTDVSKVSNELISSSNEMALSIATSGVVPWSCRARSQLYASARIILTLLGCSAVLALMYYKWVLYKRERALVERLVKEVRFFLIGRSHYRTERFYPANHLRENLFDTLLTNISEKDRTWLRDCVWPKVATMVQEDPRVSRRMASVRGQTMVVWEWISSNSPALQVKRQRTRNDRYSI